MTTELCENCGKPKEVHPTYTYYGNDKISDVEECKSFTPKKSNDSHSSQSGSKTNDKTSSENHSSFKTLKSSGSDTLFQIEQRIRKGCGKKFSLIDKAQFDFDYDYCGGESGSCPTCQAQLNLIEEIKGMIKNKFDKSFIMSILYEDIVIDKEENMKFIAVDDVRDKIRKEILGEEKQDGR